VELDDRVALRLAALAQHAAIPRIWQKDFTVWRDDPTEIADRLGWLTVHERMRERVPELERFASDCAADGLTQAVLAGMGGSSLAPEVLRETFGVSPGMLDLVVLDTTHPDQILSVERGLPLDHTLFLIASKSGTTTETLCHLDYFWDKAPDGSRFVAITDPGTPLERLASERGFRRTFLNPADIGGRYSALSYFGLVPGALMGADLERLLDGATSMASACGPDVPPENNPGARIGATIGEAALIGRDKLTLVLEDPLRSFGFWVEQLVAESTGKDGLGIVPVEGEDLGEPGVYGSDRLFVGIGSEDVETALAPVRDDGQPVIHLPVDEAVELGREFLLWEFATAVAGAVLGIHPFDQPNVQEAKDVTGKLLAQGDLPDPGMDDLGPLLEQVRAGDYLAIQAFLPRNRDSERRLHEVRMRLRDRLKVATTVGFGPRYLHSTGQLHKGGPNTGVFIQVLEPPAEDAPIPGRPYTFGTLIAAQALGDLQSLRARGRRVARVRLADLEASVKL
jgi:transaldolase/glucose-6-phosphate isomerase